MNTSITNLFGLVLAWSVLFGTRLSGAVLTVTTTADSGPGSLRQAILDANANPGPDEIRFNIPTAGVQTISPLTPPPIITDTVHIDGYTQPGAAPATATSAATILIELSGASVPGGPGVNGLTFDSGSSGSSIRGLSINRFRRAAAGTGHAILVLPRSGSHWIAGNYLNIAPDGTTVFTGTFGEGDENTIAFNSAGIVVNPTAAPGITILGNSIFSNDGLGINLGADGVTLNDALDADAGANNFQNFPMITGKRSFFNPALAQV